MTAPMPDLPDRSSDAALLLQREQALIAGAQPFAVATVIRALPPTSAWVGAQALVEADGSLHGWIGGGCSREIVIQSALETLRTGQPKLVRIAGTAEGQAGDVEEHAMPCASNGALELFIQPVLPAPLVLVMGATPTALEACVLAQRMGLRVAGAAPVSASLAGLGLVQVLDDFDTQAITRLDPAFVLVATQGDGDEPALEAALRSRARAVLMVASQRKTDTLRAAMLARGIPEARLASLHAPAGPAIHARTPQEIALGAVAGLIALRREPEPPPAAGVAPVLPCEAISPPEATRYLNPVCGMAIERTTAKYVVDYGGELHYFCCDGCKLEFEREPEKYMAVLRNRVPT